VFLLGTGLRRSEGLALHWRDVDLTAGVARIRWQLVRVDRQLVFDEELKTPKSKGFVSLPAPVMEALRQHKVALAAERLAAPVWQPWEGHEDLVFPTRIGTPVDPRNALRALVRLAERAELTGAGLHTLGHSAERLGEASGGKDSRGYIQPGQPEEPAGKPALIRYFSVGLARFELATP